ncbi:hypothetical protein V6N13_090232 [Hibiscus sabdariffa]
MDGVPGSLGTSVGFSLRLGQTLFSCASLLFMSLGVEFYSYTAFCYLVTIMGLVIPWSFTLALVDGYSVLVKCPVRQPGVLVIIAAGDWVLSVLTLAAACSTASVVDLLFHSGGSICSPKCCSRYQLSAAMAFITCFGVLPITRAGTSVIRDKIVPYALVDIETWYLCLFTRHKELLEYLTGLQIRVRKCTIEHILGSLKLQH